MSSLLINAAPVDYKDNININKKENFSKMINKNKTLKNNNDKKLKAENFKINNDSDDDLEDFNNEINTPVQKKI